MERNGRVDRSGIECRRPYLRECSPRREILEVLRHVDPVRATVFRVPKLSVVRARPDQSLLNLRVLNVPEHLAGILSEVVAHESAVGHDSRGILGREIRTEFRPRLTTAIGLQDQLTSVQDVFCIERIDGHGCRPVTAILRLIRRGVQRDHPRLDRSRGPGARIPASHLVAVARGVNDVGVGGIGDRETGFATADVGLPLQLIATAASAAAGELSRLRIRCSRRARRLRTRCRRRL